MTWLPCAVGAMEQVTLRHQGGERTVQGRIEVEAADGGLLLLADDGVLWAIQPEELVARHRDARPFAFLNGAQLRQRLLAELPGNWEVLETAHYLICYNTSRAYAQWVGGLYERLYRGFFNYWRRRGCRLVDPPTPLIAIVFDRRDNYLSLARQELGDAAPAIVGYYSLRSNRVLTYDLTGHGESSGGPHRPGTAALVQQILSRPEAAPTVATIIHEATHQLAYNCGLQTRYADNPLWLSEGLAIYFETPDLQSSRGWRSIGAVNGVRLARLQADLPARTPARLMQMLTEDEIFRDGEQAIASYAEAWGWCYFLSKRHPAAFTAYLQELSQKEPLQYDTPAQRVAAFRQFFGEDLAALDEEFVRFMATLR